MGGRLGQPQPPQEHAPDEWYNYRYTYSYSSSSGGSGSGEDTSSAAPTARPVDASEDTSTATQMAHSTVKRPRKALPRLLPVYGSVKDSMTLPPIGVKTNASANSIYEVISSDDDTPESPAYKAPPFLEKYVAEASKVEGEGSAPSPLYLTRAGLIEHAKRTQDKKCSIDDDTPEGPAYKVEGEGSLPPLKVTRAAMIEQQCSSA